MSSANFYWTNGEGICLHLFYKVEETLPMISTCVLQDDGGEQGGEAERLELRALEMLKNMKNTRLNVIFSGGQSKGML